MDEQKDKECLTSLDMEVGQKEKETLTSPDMEGEGELKENETVPHLLGSRMEEIGEIEGEQKVKGPLPKILGSTEEMGSGMEGQKERLTKIDGSEKESEWKEKENLTKMMGSEMEGQKEKERLTKIDGSEEESEWKEKENLTKMIGSEMESVQREGTQLRLIEDMVIEILLKLPHKALMRFKALNTKLLTIISSTSFLNTNAKRPIPKLMGLERNKEGKAELISLDLETLVCCRSLLSTPRARESLPINSDSIDLIGAIEGFICLSFTKDAEGKEEKIFCWNPNTGECIEGHCFDRSDRILAFGFDRMTGTYLVFMGSNGTLLKKKYAKTGKPSMKVTLYKLGGKSESLGEHVEWPRGRGVQVENTMFWVTYSTSVLAFNLEHQNFYDIRPPTHGDDLIGCSLHAVTQEKLACTTIGLKTSNIWTLCEDSDSWQHILRVENIDRIQLALRAPQPLFLHGKQLLYMHSGKLILYDMRDATTTMVEDGENYALVMYYVKEKM